MVRRGRAGRAAPGPARTRAPAPTRPSARSCLARPPAVWPRHGRGHAGGRPLPLLLVLLQPLPRSGAVRRCRHRAARGRLRPGHNGAGRRRVARPARRLARAAGPAARSHAGLLARLPPGRAADLPSSCSLAPVTAPCAPSPPPAVFVLPPPPGPGNADAWGRFKISSTGALAPANYAVRFNTTGGVSSREVWLGCQCRGGCWLPGCPAVPPASARPAPLAPPFPAHLDPRQPHAAWFQPPPTDPADAARAVHRAARRVGAGTLHGGGPGLRLQLT